MSKLPVVSGRDLIKFLVEIGFEIKRQKGSHVFLKSHDNKFTTVPLQSELDRGTLGAILEQIDIQRDDFIRLYKR